MLVIRVDCHYKAKHVGAVDDDHARCPHSVLEQFAKTEAEKIGGTFTVYLLHAVVCLPAGKTRIEGKTVIGPALWCKFHVLPEV